MQDRSLQDHLSIVGLLPDFVLGKLDETSLRRVAKHLEQCATCRQECANAMDVLAALADVPPPPVCLREAILRRAAEAEPIGQRDDADADPGASADRQKASHLVPLRVAPDTEHMHTVPFGAPRSRRVVLVASAAVFLVSGLLGLNYERHHASLPAALSQDARIEALMADPAAAYPLDDSDLPIPARGVVFAEPTGREVYLMADGLPALPPDRRYQVWLFTGRDGPVSLGMVSSGANGKVRALFETPAPFDTYIALSLTAEPTSGRSKLPPEEVLGGTFPAASALLPTTSDDAATG